jgi:hypothetical protein
MTVDKQVGLRTLWAVLFLVQFLVIGFGALIIALDILSTPSTQATFSVDRNQCTEQQTKLVSEGKAPPLLVSHCATLEKHVAALEGVQVQITAWMERGLLVFLLLNFLYVLIGGLILLKSKKRDA